MLTNWLKAVDPNLIDSLPARGKVLGKKLLLHHKSLPKLRKGDIALIGVGKTESDAVRRQLYHLSFPFTGMRIADLGDLRKRQLSFVIPLLKELLEGGVFPILLCPDPQFIWSQYQAHLSMQSSVNLGVIDERVPSYLRKVLKQPPDQLFHLSLLACQSHFTDPKVFETFEERNFDILRLGALKTDIGEAEPLLRDADGLSFHLQALKQAEAPGQLHPSPNGLLSEEACQLARYAGMSDKLSSAGFYGFVARKDRNQQTAGLLAQMIWYLLDGIYSRKNDFPRSTDGLVEYIVESVELTFWKSSKTGRWWIQVPVDIKGDLGRHRLIPCSYNDYVLACSDEVPERLVKAFKRFDQ